MRTAYCLIGLAFLVGCDQSPPAKRNPSAPSVGTDSGAQPHPSDPPVARATKAAGFVENTESLPPELGTRPRGEDWPAFLGPRGDSTSIEKGIVTNWGNQQPRVVWEQPLGTGYGTAAISRGRLLHFGRFGDQARLTCLNSETAEELWRFEYPTDYADMYNYNNGPRCCPIVDDSRVYTFGAEGMLHCVRIEDGKPIWRVDTAEQFGVIQNFFGVGSTPVLYGDLLIVHVGGSPPESRSLPRGQLDRVEPNGSGVVAFDKRTGKVRYKLGDELASYASPTVRRIGGRDWCFVLARGGLLAFDPKTGKQDFHYPWRAQSLESVNASNPVVVDDLVFISECYGPGSSLLKVRPGGYDVVWADSELRRQKAMQTHWNTCVHHEGYLYGSSGRHETADLRCIELKTGKVQWKHPDLTRSSLLYVDGHFVCLTEIGDLLLVRADPEKFAPVGQLNLVAPGPGPQPLIGDKPPPSDPFWAAPILSHGLLYIRGNNKLICLELIPQPTKAN